MEALERGHAVWLYGSVARGDADGNSDLDLLLIGTPTTRSSLESLLSNDPVLKSHVDRRTEVSCLKFSWVEFRRMTEYGSLFLHHVAVEGRPLLEADDGRSARMLKDLVRYERGQAEMRCLRIAVEDVERSIQSDHSPAFELAVVATALRHAFILGCYSLGKPTFGRATPFTALAPQLGFASSSVDDLVSLYDFRLHQHGRAVVPFEPQTSDVVRWISIAHDLLDKIGQFVDDFYSAVPSASG